MNANYLGGRAGEVAGYAMPAHAALAGLPPTTIVNSEYDDLPASVERFAEQLAEAGVAVDVYCEAGVLHGHLNTPPSLLRGSDHTLALFAEAVIALGAPAVT